MSAQTLTAVALEASEAQNEDELSRRFAGSVKLVAASPLPKAGDAERLSGLLVATSRGDRLAFARLYELTSGKLFAVALRIVGRRDAAEEILQDAFLTIWQQAGQHRPGAGSPFGWMVTVVRHRAIDRLRKDRRAAMQQIREIESVAADLDPHFDESMATGCMNESVRECFDNLPANHRHAVLAAFFHGLSHDELAQRLDVPIGTAKSWVRRGLRQLRACLESQSRC